MISIRFDKLAVSNFLRYGFNIKPVSVIFNFSTDALPELILKASIRFDKEIVSVAILSETYLVFANKPVKGKLTLLAPVVVMVISPTPLKFMFWASVIVLPSLLTPVPPLEPGTIVLIDIAESATVDLDAKRA